MGVDVSFSLVCVESRRILTPIANRSTRVHNLCVQIMEGSTKRTMIRAARGVVPRVEKMAAKLLAVAKVNRAVHGPRYALIIRQEENHRMDV